MEGHYHKSCYKEYTQNVKKLSTSSTVISNESQPNPYKDVELEAFKEIVKECYELTEIPRVLSFRDLLKKMEDIFSSKDIVMRDSTRKYLQRNLEKLNIIKFQNIEGKLYVSSKSNN